LQWVTLKMPVALVGKTTQPQLEQNFEAAAVVVLRGQQALVKRVVLHITPAQVLVLGVVVAALMAAHLLLDQQELRHLAAQVEVERQVLVQAQAEPQQHWQP
jgi:hypothetical protein